jgi:formylglycine-generating enzyme required for sulfatase activity
MDKHKHLDQLFDKARKQPVSYSFDEAKSKFIDVTITLGKIRSLGSESLISYKIGLIMFSALSALVSVVVIYTQSTKNQVNRDLNYHTQQRKEMLRAVVVGETKTQTRENVSKKISHKVCDDLHSEIVLSNFSEIIDQSIIPNFEQINYLNLHDKSEEPYFPTLTEKEITVNNKKKKQMLKAFEKFDKKEYVRMPSGSFEYEGKIISLQSFVIQRTEITNEEYRTFLFDLLIQGRKDEFLKATPDQSQWTKTNGSTSFMDEIEEDYFSHPAFNNYPVVNISREGAELYCKWLSQELVKYVDNEDLDQYNDVRLPGRVEWVYAASAAGVDYPYPWKGQYLRDSKGFFLANYKPFENSYIDDGGFITVKVDSYSPNSVGLYNMSGNVSEMVYNAPNSRKDPGTAGGSWMSNSEEIKILGPDPHTGKTDAHPSIGFRVVMTVTK